MQRSRGFTLIELAVSVSVVGVLAGIALPAMQDAFEATRSGAAKAELYETWMASVAHAVNTGSEVVLCPGDASGCRQTIDWSRGWIAYADIDGNRQRGAYETLLHEQPTLPGKVHLRSTTGRTRIIFQPDGGNAGSNITWTLCDGRGAARATTIVVSNQGRLRSGKPTPEAAEACMRTM